MNRDEAQEFEDEVARTAREMYPSDLYGGPTVLGGRERDLVIETDDLILLIEATISRGEEKARKDGQKLRDLADQMAGHRAFKAIKAYFITRDEPTAQQSDIIRNYGQPLQAIGYAKFRAKLIDSKAYIAARQEAAFGSARDPETDAFQVTDKYVPLDFIGAEDHSLQLGISDIFESLLDGRRTVVLGDYGTGKSMTLRELFIKSRKAHLRKSDTRFAIHLNLNDHQGQQDPAEALVRHAAKIGFENPNQLIRAWRAGAADLLLDGFDEIVSSGSSLSNRPIAEVRKKSVELVRRFLDETPRCSGVVVAGREHYFDSLEEMKSALKLKPEDLIVTANDFTEGQVAQYLENREWTQALPEWLPRRPLLIGYMASRRLFERIDGVEETDAGAGWSMLLGAICEREERATDTLDAITIRRMIERLATLARKSLSGLGPLKFQDLVQVFQDMKGVLPDEGAYSLLQRLPGLRVVDGDTNRSFVDDDFADAARAGDVFNWIEHPHDIELPKGFSGAQNLLHNVGMDVLSYRAQEAEFSDGQIRTALWHAQEAKDGMALVADVLRIMLQLGIRVRKTISIQSLHIPTLEIEQAIDGDLITFQNCVIDEVEFASDEALQNMPYFLAGTAIERFIGASRVEDLPEGRLSDFSNVLFDAKAENSSSILSLNLPDKQKVALTILTKIFGQHGKARKQSAFSRGSLTQSQRQLVKEMLDALYGQGAILKSKRGSTVLWAQNRAYSSRVSAILANPSASTDSLLQQL